MSDDQIVTKTFAKGLSMAANAIDAVEAERDALAARLRETEARCERLRRVTKASEDYLYAQGFPEAQEKRDALARMLYELPKGDLVPA